jgi:branched-chain amino acid aminotransferase
VPIACYDTAMSPKYTWMNGRLVPWADSHLHVGTEAVLRGASVFEGIRAYSSADGDLLLFRFSDHIRRLIDSSMRFFQMRLSYEEADYAAGIAALLRANEVTSDAHIRVVAYFDELRLGKELEADAGAFILAHEQLKPAPPTTRATLSAWRRSSDLAIPPRIKASGNYLNTRIAATDAYRKGYDSAIFLNERGKVAEGQAMNLFLVRRGELVTPRVTDGILEGVTRATVIELGRAAGIPVVEREVDPSELYIAEELFLCGTAYEVAPVVGLDGYVIGDGQPGPITTAIQQTYMRTARGEAPAPDGWCTSVRAILDRTGAAAHDGAPAAAHGAH